jgi:hypothetical protein
VCPCDTQGRHQVARQVSACARNHNVDLCVVSVPGLRTQTCLRNSFRSCGGSGGGGGDGDGEFLECLSEPSIVTSAPTPPPPSSDIMRSGAWPDRNVGLLTCAVGQPVSATEHSCMYVLAAHSWRPACTSCPAWNVRGSNRAVSSCRQQSACGAHASHKLAAAVQGFLT